MLDFQKLIKYVLEGAAVAAAAYYIPRRNIDLNEVAMIALTAAAVFAVLDHFAPSVAAGARQGSGFGIGYNIATGLQGFEDGDSDSDNDSDSDDETDCEDDTDVPVGVDTHESFASVI